MSDILRHLEQVIADRKASLAQDPATADNSYVAKLLAKPARKRAEKLGEEAVETVIAALVEDDAALARESADLLFHLLIVLAGRGISFQKVLEVLEEREGTSGLVEKAGRSASN